MPAMPSDVQPPEQPKTLPLWRLGPAIWLATGSWVGFSPIMPGTFGALLGLPLAYAIWEISLLWVQVAVIVAIALTAVPICTAAARRLGRKDPGCVILDEIVSLPVTFFLLPANEPAVLALGFVLHRVFDILKPFPVRQVERLPEGWGIVADDLMAGVYSNLALWSVTGLGLFRLLGT
jgi:phosphatidylglycerophosphatase A